MDAGAPERTLVVGDTSWVGAGRGWVERRITFGVEVETGAESGGITQGGAADDVVARKCVEAEVGILRNAFLEVHECLHVGRVGVSNLLSLGMERLVALERTHSIGTEFRTVT